MLKKTLKNQPTFIKNILLEISFVPMGPPSVGDLSEERHSRLQKWLLAPGFSPSW